LKKYLNGSNLLFVIRKRKMEKLFKIEIGPEAELAMQY